MNKQEKAALKSSQTLKYSMPIIENKKNTSSYSKMAIAIQQIAGKIDTDQSGLYNQNVTIRTGDVTIKNDELDMEFDIPFDDDTEANEAEITVYNLTNKTINAMKRGQKITVTAGYGKDTGLIFSGYISTKKTKWEDTDKVTTITAIDNKGKKERELTSMAFAKGTKASAILKKLVSKLGMPVAVFKTSRDYTYKDKTTVDGGLMENIHKYASICGVSAYICKSKVYVAPLTYGEHDTFNLSADTGLLECSEFEEENTEEKYTDHIKGLNVKMLLTHKVQTGSILNINTKNIKGVYRVREGSHTYDNDEFLTTVKAISFSSIKTTIAKEKD